MAQQVEPISTSADHQSLASSLPGPSSEDFKKRRSRREGSLDADSLKLPASLEFAQRPRSASLHVSNIRHSLRGLSRARPSSARSGKAKLHGGVLRREVSTQEVDSAFARIKQQLAQFSEEDQVLKDRLDKLIEEINDLRNAHRLKRLRCKRSSSEQPNSPNHLKQQGNIALSASEANLIPLNSELKQSEMESQVIFLKVSESENNLVQLTEDQYQTESPISELMTSESDHTQTETGTGSPIPVVVISESESSQTGTESPIPVMILESEDSQTGSQSETDSMYGPIDTVTECPESEPSKRSELTSAESPLPAVVTSALASHDINSDPEQQIQTESGTEHGSIPTQFTSFGEGNGSLPDQESKEHQTLSATYYISCGGHLSGSASSDASFQSFVGQEHSPLSGTEDVFFGD